MKKIRIHLVVILTCLLTYENILADINGTSTPVILTTKYNFINGERADGDVSFLQGFDIPTNGTVTLNLYPGSIINNNVSFNNNSTLILEANCEFDYSAWWSGSGFIKPNGNTIILKSPIELTGSDKIVFTNEVTVAGVGGFAGLFGTGTSVIDVSRAASRFSDVLLGFAGSSLFETGSSDMLWRNVQFHVGGNNTVTINSQQLTTQGNCIIRGNVTIPNRLRYLHSDVLIPSQSKLTVGELWSAVERSRMILDNSILDIVNTSSPLNVIEIGNIISNLNFQGNLIVRGQSILRSSIGNDILFSPKFKILFEPGARLTIDSGTKVTIQQ